MSPHVKTALRDLGVVLHVPGVMALASIPIAWTFGEDFAIWPLLVASAVSLLPGQFLYWRYRRAGALQLRHAMVVVVLAWLLIPLIGTLPLLLVAAHFASVPGTSESVLGFGNFWNALFEAMSGFTSTGLTMAPQPSTLPHILQWWRSLMQWVGGVGIIVLMLSVFHPSRDSYRLYFAEARERTILPGIAASVRTVWWIYLLYTISGIAMLRVSGMDWWQAVNYGMTGIATGGFGVTDNSLGDFGVAPRLMMIVIMLAGAISFATHYGLLTRGGVRLLWKDAEYHVLFIMLALGTVLLAFENLWYGGAAAWLDSLFQWTSALATAGFGTVALDTWSPTAHLLLALAMICGGAAGATTGGLKLKRVVVLAEGTFARIRGIVRHPWRLMDHKPMADAAEEAHTARLFEAAIMMAALWAITLIAGTLLLLHAAGPDVALDRVFLEVSSALNNVGLSTGLTAPDLHWSGKLGLIVIMWMGRLEIVPVLVLIAALARAVRAAMGTSPSH